MLQKKENSTVETRRIALLAHSRFDWKYPGWVFREMAGAFQPLARKRSEIQFRRFALTPKSSWPTLLDERT